MQQTAIGAALARAGLDTRQIALRRIARNCLDLARGNTQRAAAALAATVARDPELLIALIGRPEIEQRAADLVALMNSNGDGLCRIAEPGNVPMPPPLEPNAVLGSLLPRAFPARDRLPSKTAPRRSDDGHSRDVNQARVCLPSSDHPVAAGGHHNGAVPAEDSLPPAAPRRTPNPPRGLAAIASIQPTMAKSIMDTFRIRDGRPIGDVSWGEIGGLIADNDREARVLRAVRMHIAEAPSDALIRDIVRASVIEAALTRVPDNV